MLFNYKKIVITVLAAASIAVVGCKKDYLATTPSDQISVDELFSTTKAAYTLLNGMHNYMTRPVAAGLTNHADWAQKSQDMGHDAMGRDMILTSSNYDWFSSYYQYVSTSAANFWMPYNSWTFYYKLINNANSLIANIDNASGPQSEKDDIKGQALAYRAWAYWRLANDFCLNYNAPGFAAAKGVPLMLEPTDIRLITKGRGLASEVYAQILIDIKESVTLLGSTSEDRPNKSHINIDVANGLYARIALGMRDYPTAAIHAEIARSNYPLMSSTALNGGFNTNTNEEWMWSSALTAEQYQARGILCFVGWMDIDIVGSYASVGATRAITKQLFDLMDPTDVRREQFRSPTSAAGLRLVTKKFRTSIPGTFTADDLLMRATEMYLIEIEALASINPNDTRAVELLEELMQIRQPGYTLAATGRTLIEEVLLQRRIELWGEGFALNDIKRLQINLARATGTLNHSPGTAAVMNLPANSPRFLFKIPQRELDNNSSMTGADQNP